MDQYSILTFRWRVSRGLHLEYDIDQGQRYGSILIDYQLMSKGKGPVE